MVLHSEGVDDCRDAGGRAMQEQLPRYLQIQET
jgi:hypothetical protein